MAPGIGTPSPPGSLMRGAGEALPYPGEGVGSSLTWSYAAGVPAGEERKAGARRRDAVCQAASLAVSRSTRAMSLRTAQRIEVDKRNIDVR